jgi:hypothetical protein
MRLDEMPEDLVKTVMEDPERHAQVQQRAEQMRHHDAQIKRGQNAGQKLAVHLTLQSNDKVAGLQFADTRGSSTYLASLWEALVALYRLELQRLGYYPKPGAEIPATWFAPLGNMYAEMLGSHLGLEDYPEQSESDWTCPRCVRLLDERDAEAEEYRALRHSMGPDADTVAKCRICGYEPFGVVQADAGTVHRHTREHEDKGGSNAGETETGTC